MSLSGPKKENQTFVSEHMVRPISLHLCELQRGVIVRGRKGGDSKGSRSCMGRERSENRELASGMKRKEETVEGKDQV